MENVLIAAGASIVTIFATLLLLNLRGGEKTVEKEVARLYDAEDPQFGRVMSVLLGPAIIGGNQFKELLNGDEIFPAMLEAIRGAQKSITFESYIYWSGSVGQQFAEALSERARAGVPVHLLLDWLGSYKLDEEQFEMMVQAGVKARRFHKPVWYHLHRFNNRTHRKLLVIDGKVGFTGGVGIADEWSGHAQDPRHWRDTHFRAEGPVVAQMQATFMDNWMKVTRRVLHGPEYFPDLGRQGEQEGQMFSSSPSGGSESMRLMYLLAITAAARTIHLCTPYFVPDNLVAKSLCDAAKRGVRVSIITPGKRTDSETVRRASRARWGELLEAGIEIFQYQPTMYHSKVMIVDGLWVSVGSTNFDSRSFYLNDEANLNIFHAGFACRQIEIFLKDVEQSKPVTLRQWKRRPMVEKALDTMASLLRLQL